jgi:hypothetical protein
LRLIFEGKNDLVVDTLSMTQFAAGSVFPAGNLHDFATNAETHHCNHFESDKTLDFISESLRFRGYEAPARPMRPSEWFTPPYAGCLGECTRLVVATCKHLRWNGYMVRLRSAATLLTVVVFASTARAATAPGAQSWPPQLQLQSRPVTIDRVDVLDADDDSQRQLAHHRRQILVLNGLPYISSRYAIDRTLMENGASHSGDEQTNSAYYAYGKRVLAVADGIEGHRQLPS